MKLLNKLPHKCPSYSSMLTITELHCTKCERTISNAFDLPCLFTLDKEEQEFVVNFVKSSGSLKEMEKLMGLSDPTVHKYLDNIIEKLDTKK